MGEIEVIGREIDKLNTWLVGMEEVYKRKTEVFDDSDEEVAVLIPAVPHGADLDAVQNQPAQVDLLENSEVGNTSRSKSKPKQKTRGKYEEDSGGINQKTNRGSAAQNQPASSQVDVLENSEV